MDSTEPGFGKILVGKNDKAAPYQPLKANAASTGDLQAPVDPWDGQ